MSKIEAKNVNFFYSDFHALKNISMQMEEHTVTAFIGPSGCGKSTLLNPILNIILFSLSVEVYDLNTDYYISIA